MYQCNLQKVLAKDITGTGGLLHRGDFLETHAGMRLRISEVRKIGNYLACRTAKGTYWVKSPKSVPEKGTFVGIIRKTPVEGEQGIPLEFIDHRYNDDLTVLDNPYGVSDTKLLEIKHVKEIWNDFYCVEINSIKYYVIRVK